MNDQTIPATFAGQDEFFSDDSMGASLEIDFAEIIATTEPDQPGGRAAIDSDDYETDEEEDAAFEAFVMRIIEAPYDKT
jgi:hypothetical protein